MIEKNAVQQLKFPIKNRSLLALLQADGHLTIDIDAWDTQLGCIILQKQQDGTMRPIAH